ncbi:IS4/Tn5 family transposase DNA-binding protein [Nostoc sp.]|uniref:IS4/Tn5 family transposase DNA-binding protein n=1 Tax=Nostoc sp. TaxID=1180 RepID=UPI003FA5CA7D
MLKVTSCLLDWWEKNFATCELGDIRLNQDLRKIVKKRTAKERQRGLGEPVRWAASPTCSRSVSPWEKHLAWSSP